MAYTYLDTAIPMMRILLNDYTSTPMYSDNRLHELFLVAAQYVSQELGWSTTYTVTFPELLIEPDPILETDFLNFCILKASCIGDQSIYRTKALAEGIKVRLGPADIAIANNLRGFRELIEFGPCFAYKQLKQEYIWGNTSHIKAVLSPFVSNQFDPRNLGYGGPDSGRDRYFQ